MFICPVCGQALELYEKSYRCSSGHSFDVSAKGYVNLLLSKGRNPAKSGDNKLMVKARSDFLDKGWYRPLAERTAELIAGYTAGLTEPAVIDSGCGEGYYTLIYAQAVKQASFFGIDISKAAVMHAASRARQQGTDNVRFAAASSFQLPFADSSADVVSCTFAPVTGEEYDRVLKPGGRLIIVSPGARHLFALKSLLYEHPYENRPNVYDLPQFGLEHEEQLDYSIFLENSSDITALYTMTPYYYKSPRGALEKLAAAGALDCECSFDIRVYRTEKR